MRSRDTDLQDCDSTDCKLPKQHEGLCSQFLPVMILYTNHNGRQAKRKVSPTGQVVHEANAWHKIPQWVFECIDCEDGKQKRFAFTGVNAGRDALVAAISMRWSCA